MGGTPNFLPPEQITHFRDVGPAADQYSAAATLYTLLTDGRIYDLPKDVGEALEELKGKGVHVVFGPFDSSACYMGVVLDPDGNQIFLHRRHDGTAG